LKWLPPKDDGGSKLTGYVIEQAEVSSSSASPMSVAYWQNVESSVLVTDVIDSDGNYTYNVARLTTGKFMFFRVAAQNKQGVGAFATTSEPIKVTSPHGMHLFFPIC
jgi:titin